MFKQHYTYFHTLFHPYVFSKITNNITRITLSNWSLVSEVSNILNFLTYLSKNGQCTQPYEIPLIKKKKKSYEIEQLAMGSRCWKTFMI